MTATRVSTTANPASIYSATARSKVLCFFFSKKKAFLPLAFLLLALPSAVTLALITPPGHVPDEYNHACRADSLLHGALIGHRGQIDGQIVSGVACNEGLRLIIQLPARPTDPTPEIYTRKMDRFSRRIAWSAGPAFLEAGSIAGYMPVFYVPGALAIGVTRAFGGLPAAAFRAMRFANLACFAVIGAFALGIAQRKRGLMACTLLLPMTLSLAASCSQDGLLIACAALACACLTRAGVPGSERWRAAAAVLLAVVIASKPPYAPLALLLFLPAPRPFWPTLAVCALVVLPAVGWVGLELHETSVPPHLPPAPAGPLWPGAPAMFSGPDFAAQFRVLTVRPWRLIALPWRALVSAREALLRQAIGVLDYLSLVLPAPLYGLWLAALGAGALSDAFSGAGPVRNQARLLPVTAVFLSATAVALALYLQWTPVGMPWIGGLEGRYFLPFLPVLALALPGWAGPRMSRALLCVPLVVALTDLVWLPGVVLAFYGSK